MSIKEPIDAPTGGGEAISSGAVEHRHSDGAPAGKSRVRHLLAVALPPIVLGLIIIGCWYFVSYVVLAENKRFLLRPAHQVIEVGFLDWENFSEILQGLWSSTRVAIIGLAIAIVLGISPP